MHILTDNMHILTDNTHILTRQYAHIDPTICTYWPTICTYWPPCPVCLPPGHHKILSVHKLWKMIFCLRNSKLVQEPIYRSIRERKFVFEPGPLTFCLFLSLVRETYLRASFMSVVQRAAPTKKSPSIKYWRMGGLQHAWEHWLL